jgi:hypothetical protein
MCAPIAGQSWAVGAHPSGRGPRVAGGSVLETLQHSIQPRVLPAVCTMAHQASLRISLVTHRIVVLIEQLGQCFPRPRSGRTVGATTKKGARGSQSARNEVIGETRDVRTAGIAPAAIATTSSTAAATAYVHGSLGDTPKSSDASTEDTAIAAVIPSAAPVSASRRVSPTTLARMRRLDAPSAIRTPISGVRRATE